MNILVISAGLFSVGLYGVLVRRDIIAILASVEVMLAGPLVMLVAFGGALAAGSDEASGAVSAVGLVVIVIAAAEAAVGLALLVAVARSRRATRIDELVEVRG
jgi:NADH:ubiquinone oxidoreductase subunit K